MIISLVVSLRVVWSNIISVFQLSSYEERPISRLPNPFLQEELQPIADVDLPPPPPGSLGDLEPGLHNLTTLLETVRMASEELRNDNNDSSPQQPQVWIR